MAVAMPCKRSQPAPGRRRRTGWLTALGALVLSGWALAQSPPGAELRGTALVAALRAGGYNLYFRHAATDWSQSDRVAAPGDWISCDPGRIRQLSAQGRHTATEVGRAMRALRIPVGKVYASPYCRTRDTATAMELGPVEALTDIINLRVAEYFGGRAAVAQRTRARLARPPAAGTNAVFVAHGNLAREATGVYPGEGEGLVFRPLGAAGFEFVGRLDPAQWSALARDTDPAGRPER